MKDLLLRFTPVLPDRVELNATSLTTSVGQRGDAVLFALESVNALDRPVPEVTHIVRPVGAATRAVLAYANDGHLYIVKMPSSEKSPDALFREAAGYELYRCLRLPVPGWTALNIRPWLIENSQVFWRDSKPSSGLCFGSRFFGGAVYGWLPASMLNRIANRADFWSAWVIDTLANLVEFRQALFVSSGVGIKAVFIDHSRMFGDSEQSEVPAHSRARYWDSRIYPPLSARDRAVMSARFKRFDVGEFLHRLRSLPAEWTTPSAMRRVSDSIQRLSENNLVKSTFEAINADILERLAKFDDSRAQSGKAATAESIRLQQPARARKEPLSYEPSYVAAD